MRTGCRIFIFGCYAFLCLAHGSISVVRTDGFDSTSLVLMDSYVGLDVTDETSLSDTTNSDVTCCDPSTETTVDPVPLPKSSWTVVWDDDAIQDDGAQTATLDTSSTGVMTASTTITVPWACPVGATGGSDDDDYYPDRDFTVVSVEVEINNTSTTDDDGVIYQSVPVTQVDLSVPCRARIVGTSDATAVVLGSTGGKIQFGSASSQVSSLELTLAANSGWTAFRVYGVTASTAMNDEKITAALGTSATPLSGVAEIKPLTVYSFGDPVLTVDHSNNYGKVIDSSNTDYCFLGTNVRIGQYAVAMTCSAEVRPSGANRSNFPLSEYQVGIVQNAIFDSSSIEVVYDEPVIDSVHPDGPVSGVSIPKERIFTYSDTGTYLDAGAGSAPIFSASALVDMREDSSGTELGTAGDSPGIYASLMAGYDTTVAGKHIYFVYTRLKSMAYIMNFKTWAVAYNATANKTIPLRQKLWSVDVTNLGSIVTGGEDVTASVASPGTPNPVLSAPFANNVHTQTISNGTAGNVSLSYP